MCIAGWMGTTQLACSGVGGSGSNRGFSPALVDMLGRPHHEGVAAHVVAVMVEVYVKVDLDLSPLTGSSAMPTLR